jgi:hypothetical protein
MMILCFAQSNGDSVYINFVLFRAPDWLIVVTWLNHKKMTDSLFPRIEPYKPRYLRNTIHFLSVIGIWYEIGRVIKFYNARTRLTQAIRRLDCDVIITKWLVYKHTTNFISSKIERHFI